MKRRARMSRARRLLSSFQARLDLALGPILFAAARTGAGLAAIRRIAAGVLQCMIGAGLITLARALPITLAAAGAIAAAGAFFARCSGDRARAGLGRGTCCLARGGAAAAAFFGNRRRAGLRRRTASCRGGRAATAAAFRGALLIADGAGGDVALLARLTTQGQEQSESHQ